MSESYGSGRDLRRDITFAFAIAVVCYIAWLIRDVLVLLYVSALFAVVLRPAVRAVSRFQIWRWRPFRGYAILVMLLFAAGALTAFGFLAFPPVIRDLRELAKEAPERLPAVLEKLKPLTDREMGQTEF